MASIGDVARLAGVSMTTVSHTLSGKRKVSARVREQVLAAMDQLGYVPNRAAQAMSSGRTRMVGLLVPDIRNEFFAALTSSIEQRMMANGYNVVLGTTGFDHSRERFYLEMIRSRAVDGLIYAAGAPPSESELVSILGDLPLVLVDEAIPGANRSLVISDNHAGGALMAAHLRGLGHVRSLIVSAGGSLESDRSRVEGFTEEWIRSGGEPPEIAVGSFSENGGRAAIARWLPALASSQITSVFATNDLMAIGVNEVLTKVGVRIPEDVSLAGFDDISLSSRVTPPLTTVRQDVDRMGEHAAQALLEALEHDGPASPVVTTVPVELVVRDSTRRVPQRGILAP